MNKEIDWKKTVDNDVSLDDSCECGAQTCLAGIHRFCDLNDGNGKCKNVFGFKNNVGSCADISLLTALRFVDPIWTWVLENFKYKKNAFANITNKGKEFLENMKLYYIESEGKKCTVACQTTLCYQSPVEVFIKEEFKNFEGYPDLVLVKEVEEYFLKGSDTIYMTQQTHPEIVTLVFKEPDSLYPGFDDEQTSNIVGLKKLPLLILNNKKEYELVSFIVTVQDNKTKDRHAVSMVKVESKDKWYMVSNDKVKLINGEEDVKQALCITALMGHLGFGNYILFFQKKEETNKLYK
jgi:hypothetical protein